MDKDTYNCLSRGDKVIIGSGWRVHEVGSVSFAGKSSVCGHDILLRDQLTFNPVTCQNCLTIIESMKPKER